MADYKRPIITTTDAAQLAKKLFGFVKVLEVKEFKSFVDRNFYLRGIRGSPAIQCNKVEEFVLKVLNAQDSQNVDVIDAENDVMMILRDKGFPCPDIIPASDGGLKIQVELPCSEGSSEKTDVCIVRMLSLLPGVELDEAELNNELFYKVGKFIGDASKAMKDSLYPALKRNYTWSILYFPSMTSDYLQDIDNEEVKSIVNEVWTSYERNVIPHLHKFRTGTVNGDISGENILVSKSSIDKSGYEITGFIDFGDIAESVILIEVIAPMVCFIGRSFEASGHILAGYQSSLPLPQLEFDSLYYVAAARLCQLVVYSMISAKEKQNNNTEYMDQIVDKYFNILKKLWACPKKEIEQSWRDCQQMWGEKKMRLKISRKQK